MRRMGIGLEDEALDKKFEEWVRKLCNIVIGYVPDQGQHFMSTKQICWVDWNPHLGCGVISNGLCPLKSGQDGCGLEISNNSLKNVY